MIQNNGYIEFDIKALFFYVLRHWKPVIVFCIAVAVLLGGFMAYSEHQTSLTVDTETRYWAEYQQFQGQLALHEGRISATQEKIDVLQDYLDNSVLMNTDHRNVYIAKATYYVDSGYQVLPDHTYQTPDKTYTMAWYYCDYLKDYQIFESVGAEVGIDAKYLMELVDVYIANSDILSISVSHADQQSAERIMAAMQAQLESIHLHLENTVGEHDVTKMMDTCGIYIDESLKNAQQQAHDEMLKLQDELLVHKQDLYTLKEGPAPDDLNTVKAFIKWFILGGVAAGILSVGYLLLLAILKNRIYSTAQLSANFQAGVYGELILGDSLSPVSRMLNNMEGCLAENSEENIQFIAENIRYHLGDSKNILICCDADATISRSFADSMNAHCPGIRFIPAGNLLREAAALRALMECDTVVMIAVRDQSKSSLIKKALSLIHSYKKEVSGFIIAY